MYSELYEFFKFSVRATNLLHSEHSKCHFCVSYATDFCVRSVCDCLAPSHLCPQWTVPYLFSNCVCKWILCCFLALNVVISYMRRTSMHNFGYKNEWVCVAHVSFIVSIAQIRETHLIILCSVIGHCNSWPDTGTDSESDIHQNTTSIHRFGACGFSTSSWRFLCFDSILNLIFISYTKLFISYHHILYSLHIYSLAYTIFVLLVDTLHPKSNVVWLIFRIYALTHTGGCLYHWSRLFCALQQCVLDWRFNIWYRLAASNTSSIMYCSRLPVTDWKLSAEWLWMCVFLAKFEHESLHCLPLGGHDVCRCNRLVIQIDKYTYKESGRVNVNGILYCTLIL